MRAIITPATLAVSEDLVERLIKSQVEVVALVRRTDRPTGQKQDVDLSVYGTGMLAPAELRRRMEGCDVVYQDIHSFANLDPLPDEDNAVRAAWAGGQLAHFPRQRPGAIVEDVYTAPDAIVRLHLWSSAPVPTGGARRELSQPFVTDAALRLDLRGSILEVTAIVPPRVSPMQAGLVLTGSEPVALVCAELLHAWASLRTDRPAGSHRA
jgi:hypothetical protein